MVPVKPDKVIIPVPDPWQIGVLPPEILPPTETELTTIVFADEYAPVQEPLVTNALYSQMPALEGISE
jgi:hypothetical protein